MTSPPLHTPSRSLIRLFLTLGNRLPILGALGCILLELPAIFVLDVMKLPMRTLLVIGGPAQNVANLQIKLTVFTHLMVLLKFG